MWEGSSVVMLSKRFLFWFESYFCLHNPGEDFDLVMLSWTSWLMLIIVFFWGVGADEQRLLEASMAYVAGNPIMTNTEFDELKLRLRVGSCCLY